MSVELLTFSSIIQFVVGWIYGHWLEYAIHRWVLHGLGLKRGHLLSFHFHEHHRVSRSNYMEDYAYQRLGWNSSGKELVGLIFLATLHLPALWWSPWVFYGMIGSALSYYFTHRYAHVNPHWARASLSCHYDHHMGPNQNANYGVRSGWFDTLFGTREIYFWDD